MPSSVEIAYGEDVLHTSTGSEIVTLLTDNMAMRNNIRITSVFVSSETYDGTVIEEDIQGE